jgi:hypothetical protein
MPRLFRLGAKQARRHYAVTNGLVTASSIRLTRAIP